MASHEQSLQSDNLSPQPSTSGYPLEVTVIQVNPGPSAPCVDSSPLPPNAGSHKRKRGQSTEEEGEEETSPGPENMWAVETVCGQEMKLKKKRTSTVLPEHHEAFARLLKDPVVKGFLEWDRSLRLTDKYLLAMVIAYFSRAGLFCWQYQRIHFFLALYLALDMEEDYHAPREAIFSFLYGDSNCARRPLFHKLRFQFFRSMGYRAWVTKEECEEIQAFDPELWVWRRDRSLLSEIREPENPASGAHYTESGCSAKGGRDTGPQNTPTPSLTCNAEKADGSAISTGRRFESKSNPLVLRTVNGMVRLQRHLLVQGDVSA
ncbi:speedy protein E4-like [Glossophaga mutica]